MTCLHVTQDNEPDVSVREPGWYRGNLSSLAMHWHCKGPFLLYRIRVSKAPSGHNRHKYVCLQVNLQHHILCSVGAKHPFDTLIFIGVRAIGRIVISAVLQCSRTIFYGMEGYCERKITGNQRGGTAAD